MNKIRLKYGNHQLIVNNIMYTKIKCDNLHIRVSNNDIFYNGFGVFLTSVLIYTSNKYYCNIGLGFVDLLNAFRISSLQ